MKVILLQDVARIGRRFEVKDVPSGHALNFLIPRKMAEPATPESLKRLESRQKNQEVDIAVKQEAFKAALEKAQAPQTMTVEANEQGHLFKGVRAEDIAVFLNEQGIMVKAEQIQLEAPIKELGEHAILLKDGDVEGSVRLVISAA